jgi:hypothetical protein
MTATRIPLTAATREALEALVRAQLAVLPAAARATVAWGELWGCHRSGAMPVAVIYAESPRAQT